jgi:hypothetical protein
MLDLPIALKDWVEMIATAGGVIGALILFFMNNRTARQELRRKHAEAGRSLLTEMCEDIEVQNAFAMIDMEDGSEVTLQEKKQAAADKDDSKDEGQAQGARTTSVKVTWEKALAALSGDKNVDAHAKVLVRAAFDALFYYFALFDHCIDSGLVRQSDIEYPASYYIRILSQHKQPFAAYLQRHNLHQAEKFLDRWASWRAAQIGA